MRTRLGSIAVGVAVLLAATAQPASAQEAFVAGGGETECAGGVTWTFTPPLAPPSQFPQFGSARVNYEMATCASQTGSVWWRNDWDPAPRPVPVAPDPLPFETDLFTQTYEYFGDCRNAFLYAGGTIPVGQVVSGTDAHITFRKHPFYPMIGHSTEVHHLLPAIQAATRGGPGVDTGDPIGDVDALAPCAQLSGAMVWTFTNAEAVTP